MTQIQKVEISELKHNPKTIKTNILNLIELGGKVVKFELNRCSVSHIDNLKTVENKLKVYKDAINGVSSERMYRVNYDLYVRLFRQNKKYILTTPSENGDLDDSWIRKNNIELNIGSNVGKTTKYLMPLSKIYQYSVEIYKEYYQNKDYKKECSYVDQMMMYLYRIFASFVWEEESTNKILLNNEKHIRVNVLKIDLNKSKTNTNGPNIQGIFSQIPGMIDSISKGFGGEQNSELGQQFQGFGDVAKKFFSNSDATSLLMNTLGDIQNDIKNGNDLGNVIQATFSKLSNPEFSNSLRETVSNLGIDETLKEKSNDETPKIESSETPSSGETPKIELSSSETPKEKKE